MTEDEKREVETNVTFLLEMANFFIKKAALTDEDREFFAAQQNAKNCHRVVALIRKLQDGK